MAPAWAPPLYVGCAAQWAASAEPPDSVSAVTGPRLSLGAGGASGRSSAVTVGAREPPWPQPSGLGRGADDRAVVWGRGEVAKSEHGAKDSTRHAAGILGRRPLGQRRAGGHRVLLGELLAPWPWGRSFCARLAACASPHPERGEGLVPFLTSPLPRYHVSSLAQPSNPQGGRETSDPGGKLLTRSRLEPQP